MEPKSWILDIVSKVAATADERYVKKEDKSIKSIIEEITRLKKQVQGALENKGLSEEEVVGLASRVTFNDGLFSGEKIYRSLNLAFSLELSDSINDLDDLINSTTAMNAIAGSTTAMNVVINSTTAMNAIAGSTTAMNVVINSTTAMNAIIGSTTAMNAVLNSTTAMNAVLNSTTVMNAVANSSTAMNAVLNSSTAMNAVLNSSTAMNAVLNSTTAMNAVLNSSTAMNAVLNSTTAMNAVASSTTAMNAVASSTTAMNAIIGSTTAMNAVGKIDMAIAKLAVGLAGLNPSSYGSMNAVASSTTAMNAIAGSTTAMNAIIGSSRVIKVEALTNSQYWSNQYVYNGKCLALFSYIKEPTPNGSTPSSYKTLCMAINGQNLDKNTVDIANKFIPISSRFEKLTGVLNGARVKIYFPGSYVLLYKL